jgi:hypothetical protein
MLIRIRIAMGIAMALAMFLIVSTTVFAKGGFDFIAISGPDLKETVHITDASLTEDFFTFANFYEDKINAPAGPGQGYEITRHYEQGGSDVIFDRLHYYPETGFVFYDGIENGDSEYDDEWYIANPDIKSVFESALAAQTGPVAPAEKKELVSSAPEPQPAESVAQTKLAVSSFRSPLTMVLVLAAGLGILFAYAFWRRKPSAQ